MDVGQIGDIDDVRAHVREGPFERALVVVEHPGPHVRRRDDDVEARTAKAAQHLDSRLDGARPVVDARDPMAMQVDEAAHRFRVLHHVMLVERWRR